ncbi:MAG: hypothetical protein KF753_05115 [Caldilineaceae bacterium]|nr:hypothetical protein [Caldilineaceae bacterium]
MHVGSLEALRESIGCKASTGTLSRILNGRSVSVASLRDVAQAVGVEYVQRTSWERRKALRAACKARGVTMEDAAEMWLQSMKGEEK